LAILASPWCTITFNRVSIFPNDGYTTKRMDLPVAIRTLVVRATSLPLAVRARLLGGLRVK
jgi:hypothetical protein